MEDSSAPSVDEVKTLIKYTDDHFMNKLNEDLERLRNEQKAFFSNDSNSPIIMSESNSECEEGDAEAEVDVEVDDCFEEEYSSNKPLKKLTFREVRDSINKYYETDDKYSNELDILSTYLKGQKHLYMKSVSIMDTKMNMLLIPAAAGSAIITIFAPIIQCCKWNGAFISGLNAFVFLLYFFNYYFKFSSSTAIYQQLVKQYERLEHSCDSNKMVFGQKKTDVVLENLKDVEKRIADLKETIFIELPWEIKRMFPIIYPIQIFAFIKRMEIYKNNLIIKFKDIKNEIRYIQWKWGETTDQKEKCRLDFLLKIKTKIKSEILHYKNAYGSMEELMAKEIKRTESMCIFDIWFYRYKKIDVGDNPVLISYVSTIFAND